MTDILMVDDDSEFRALIVEYLGQEGVTVAQAEDGVLGLAKIAKAHYQLILLDVMMPNMSGIEVLKEIRKTNTSLPVIMLTARGEEVDRIIGLEYGADDYIPKPCNPREILARINAVLRRSNAVQDDSRMLSGQTSCGGLTMNHERHEVQWNNKMIKLTGTQYKILEMLMKNQSKVVTKDQLYLEVLGREADHFDRSIDVHMSHLRTKLSDFTGREWIETIRSVGFMLEQQDE